MTGRPQSVEDPFAKHVAASHPEAPNPAYQPAITSALGAVGQNLVAGTPAGGIAGAVVQDALDSTGQMLHLTKGTQQNRSWDALVKTLTGQLHGTVVIGEGERDEAPMLFIGEEVGLGDGPKIDIALDPLEGTSSCASGKENSIAVIRSR